jgi:phospholipase/carboxylesterase
MKAELAGFSYRFEAGTRPGVSPLLLLHGTGGTEDDLIPLAEAVAPGAPLLAPRGRVLEGSLPRFFRRHAEGVLDEDDLRLRTDELAEFLAAARTRHELAAPVAIGFSNGANMAAALLLQHPGTLAGAALLRAMPPFAEPPAADLAATPVLLLAGTHDRMIPPAQAERLAATLAAGGARLDHQTLPAGHGLGQDDVNALARWLTDHANASTETR